MLNRPILLFAALAACLPAYSRVSTLQCPAEIRTTQSVQGAPAAWAVSTEKTSHQLTSIRFSDGSPAEIAWLAPDKSSKSGVQEWVMAPSERGYWVSCGYGSTSAILSLKLPSAVKLCRVWLDKSFVPPIAVRFECQ